MQLQQSFVTADLSELFAEYSSNSSDSRVKFGGNVVNVGIVVSVRADKAKYAARQAAAKTANAKVGFAPDLP